jgi:hypothetical protein
VRTFLTYVLAALAAGLLFGGVQMVMLYEAIMAEHELSVLELVFVSLTAGLLIGGLVSLIVVSPVWMAVRGIIPALRSKAWAKYQPLIGMVAFVLLGAIAISISMSFLRGYGIPVGSEIYNDAVLTMLLHNAAAFLVPGLAWGTVFWLRQPKNNQTMEVAA